MTTETFKFKTEEMRLLDLVINALYSEKDIFLRELISNASDAVAKVKFESLTRPELIEDDSDYKVVIKVDEKHKTLTITDNGIGMSREELIENLGTIAKSGTYDFLQKANQGQSQLQELIGQFGVGFYSVFMVASKVEVISKKAGYQESFKFSSEGTGQFEIEPAMALDRGTSIKLFLKDDEYLNDYKLKSIIEKYSSYASLPIYLETFVKNEEDKEDEGHFEKELLNEQQPLWTRTKSAISDEEYKEFYKQVSKDYREPYTWLHNKIEGTNEYTYLLYIPQEVPYFLWNQEKPNNIKLHVKKIFITDQAEQLLPRYLSFISGIVDFSELPLNVSRELLQEHKIIARTKSALTKKVLSHLQSLAQADPQAYLGFWKNFGQMLKMFPGEDYANKDLVLPLLRFQTSLTGKDEFVSLDEVLARMPAEQKSLYFISAPSYDAAFNSPHMDYFKKKNIEVLLLTDRIDESLMNYLNSYKEKEIQSITQADLKDLSTDTPDQSENDQTTFEPLCKKIQDSLNSLVKEVRVSKRLTEAPCCLVVDNHISLHMQRILKEAGQQNYPASLPILEINSQHPIVQKINSLESDEFKKWTKFLYSIATLAEGGQLSDPATFAKELNSMLTHLCEETPSA